MTKQITKHVILSIIFTIIATSVFVYEKAPLWQSGTHSTKSTRQTQAMYATDYSDARKLVGAAHNVFIGQVIAQKESAQRKSRIPETQFSVVVLYNIKGALQGTVTINQFGVGYMDGALYSMSGDTIVANNKNNNALLRPGATYLFAPRYNEKFNWYTLSVPPYDSILITHDSTDYAKIVVLAQKDQEVKDIAAAYPNEILLDVDIEAQRTYNSYASRHYDAQGNLIDDTVVLHEQYLAAHPEVTPTVSSSLEPAEFVPSPEPTLEPSASAVITKTPAEESPMPTSPTPEPAKE